LEQIMNRKSLVFVAAAAVFTASLALASPASAAVTFNPATGAGFVGKGDVQLAFNWNNANLQKNASGVSFNYASTDSYEATCTWTTGEGTRGEKVHNVDHNKSTSVSSAISYDARVRNQITGFNLTGLGTTTTTGGEVPVVGGTCPGNPGTDGTWTAVALTGSTGGLYVVYSTTSVQLFY
jgi:hypothetical protein